jgi:hypothetical protein
MKRIKIIFNLLLLATILIFSSCSNDEIDIPEGKAHLNIHITDSPFPIELISSTTVTIDQVEVRKKMSEDTTEENDTFIVLSDEVLQINLLELTNGLTEQIAASDLEAGYYDMIRLHVTDAIVKMNDSTVYDLKIPSGSSSGLKVKIDPAIYLEEGETYDVLLDFDVSRSFVAKGNINGHINGFNFKPVIRGVFLGAAGRIEGNVSDTSGISIEKAMVKAWLSEYDESDLELEDNDHIVSSFTEIDGSYKLIGLPEGEYTVVCYKEGFKSDTITDVSVLAGKSADLDFKLEEDNE